MIRQSEIFTAQCGVAPEFSPCISISQANIQFEQCCRNKLLPSSCQHSCRYDVKESEVKHFNFISKHTINILLNAKFSECLFIC